MEAMSGGMPGNTTVAPDITPLWSREQEVGGITTKLTPVIPAVDMSATTEQAAVPVQTTMPEKRVSLEALSRGETPPPPLPAQSISIQNLYIQAEDCKTVFDFVRMIMQAVHTPQEVSV